MESLWLLAKINTVFQVAEKVAYGCVGLYSIFVSSKYVKDYKESVEEEELFGGER